MCGKSTGAAVIFLASLMWMAPSSMAGNVLPTWIESVEVNFTTDPVTGNQNVGILSSSEFPLTEYAFGVNNLTNPTSGTGYVTDALVDYQGNPGPVVLNVVYAALNNNPSLPESVILDVYSFPASPAPPQLDSPPTGSPLTAFSIPSTASASSPYAITLPTSDTGGGTCFLLETEIGGHDLTSQINFFGAIPEPSSFLMLGTSVLMLAILGRGILVRTKAV
jgi:hypothetical protein